MRSTDDLPQAFQVLFRSQKGHIHSNTLCRPQGRIPLDFSHLFVTGPLTGGHPDGTVVKESACQWGRYRRCVFDPWVRNIPWRKKWQPTPVFLPGISHTQRNLLGYSFGGLKELDMTKWWNNNDLSMRKRAKGHGRCIVQNQTMSKTCPSSFRYVVDRDVTVTKPD